MDKFENAMEAVAKLAKMYEDKNVSPTSQDLYIIEQCSTFISELIKVCDCEKDENMSDYGKASLYNNMIKQACDTIATILVLLKSKNVNNDTMLNNIAYKCNLDSFKFDQTGEIE